MIPKRTQRSPRRTCVPLMGIACVAWFLGFAPNTTEAGCGDYLLLPLSIARHQTLPPELIASGMTSPHQEPPCRGPNCRRLPRVPLPLPIPETSIVIDLWACMLHTAVCDLPEIAVWTLLEPQSAGREEAFRLDRPPRG